jgi:hypothetical protein
MPPSKVEPLQFSAKCFAITAVFISIGQLFENRWTGGPQILSSAQWLRRQQQGIYFMIALIHTKKMRRGVQQRRPLQKYIRWCGVSSDKQNNNELMAVEEVTKNPPPLGLVGI